MTGQTSFIEGGASGDPSERGLLSAMALSQRLGVSDQSIYNWIAKPRAGSPPLPVAAVTLGPRGHQQRWFKLEDVQAWLNANPGTGRSGGHGGRRRSRRDPAQPGAVQGAPAHAAAEGATLDVPGEELPLVKAAKQEPLLPAGDPPAKPQTQSPGPIPGGSVPSGPALTNPLEDVDLKLKLHKLEVARFEFERERGLHVPAQDVERDAFEVYQQVKQRIEALPTRATRDLMATLGLLPDDRLRIQAVLIGHIEEVLRDLSKIDEHGVPDSGAAA